jgi:guanosine-3',5'-bis(diphosphate) 3'-pyrophosphohydrolase
MTEFEIEQEKNEILRRYRRLLRYAKPFLQDDDAKIIKRAFHMSQEAHKNMRRRSGEPYIFHPLAVAQICVEEIGLGTTSHRSSFAARCGRGYGDGSRRY